MICSPSMHATAIPSPLAGSFFDGGEGGDSLTLIGTSGSDDLAAMTGSLLLNGVPLCHTGTETVRLSAVGSAIPLHSLSITNSTVLIAPGGDKVLVTESLSISDGNTVDLGTINRDLRRRIAALENLVRALNRGSAAVVEDNRRNSTNRSKAFETVTYALQFCTLEEFQSLERCPEGSPDISLELDGSERGRVFEFKSANEPDFEAIVKLLTDRKPDMIVRLTEFGTGGARSTQTEDRYFRDFLAPGDVDLARFPIEGISLAVDRVRIGPTADGGTEFTLDSRVFYNLSE